MKSEFNKNKKRSPGKRDPDPSPNDMAVEGATYFHEAICKGDKNTVQKMLKNGADLLLQTDQGRTPLYLAIFSDQTDIAKMICEEALSRGADILDQVVHQWGADKKSETERFQAIHAVMHHKNHELLKYFIDLGVNLETLTTTNKKSVFDFAIDQGDTNALHQLVKRGKLSPDMTKNEHHITPLLKSIVSGQKLPFKTLLDLGADPNMTDKNGLSPLMVASAFRDGKMCWDLLEQDAVVTGVTNSNTTILHYTHGAELTAEFLKRGADQYLEHQSEKGKTPVLFLLSSDAFVDVNAGNEKEALILAVKNMISAGADVSVKCPETGEGVDFLAVRAGDMELLKMVMDKGVEIDLSRDNGIELMAYAIASADVDFLKCVTDQIQDDVSQRIKPEHQHYFMFLAVNTKNAEIGQFLIEKLKIDVNAKDELGRTILHMAISMGAGAAFVEVLLKNGADPMIRDRNGNTALHTLMSLSVWLKGDGHFKQNIEIVDLLIGAGADPEAQSGESYNGWTPLDLGISVNGANPVSDHLYRIIVDRNQDAMKNKKIPPYGGGPII